MAIGKRRQFLHQMAFGAVAFYGRPIEVLAGAARIFEASIQPAARSMRWRSGGLDLRLVAE